MSRYNTPWLLQVRPDTPVAALQPFFFTLFRDIHILDVLIQIVFFAGFCRD